MGKHRGFTAPNGKSYKSERAYKRSLRGMFAGMNQSQRSRFRPVTYGKIRDEKVKTSGNKAQLNRVETQTVQVTTIESKKQPNGKYKLVESKDTQRMDVVNKSDKFGHTTIIEQEEGSRYTPSKIHYEVDNLGDGSIAINGVTKDGREVKKTIINQIPTSSNEERLNKLENKFVDWKVTKDPDKRLSVAELRILAKEYGIKSAGITQPTLEKRIGKKL